MAMDAMERQQAHEAYNPPVVGVGDVVLFKLKGRAVWGLATVYPPQRHGWNPGDPVGKRIALLAFNIDMPPKIIQDCYHIEDPMYVYDNGMRGTIYCWKEISSASPSDLIAVYNEVLGKCGRLEADFAESQKTQQYLLNEISRISARIEAPKQTLRPVQPQQKTTPVAQEPAKGAA
jgi:hypothetical protein